MGLSVGVVSIEYRHDPPEPIPDFFRDLIEDQNIGDFADYGDFDDDDGDGDEGGGGFGYWCGIMDDVGILDFDQYRLMERAETWCRERNLDDVRRQELLTWLTNLPWKDGSVRLHPVF